MSEPGPSPEVARVASLDAFRRLAAELEAAPIAAEPKAAPPGSPPGAPPGAPPGGSSGGATDAPQDDIPGAPLQKPPGKPPEDRPHGEIWDGCPVRPLGVNGATYWYLDTHGQLRGITKHDAQAILMLFGHMIPQLCFRFPQWMKDPETGDMTRKKSRFDQTTAAMAMIAACSERGLFDPEGAVRGVGAWSDDDGRLIYHTGDALILEGEARELTAHQGRIYPAYPPVPRPAEPGAADPVPAILDTLETWQWARPDIDPELALGMIGCQMFGGALDWRPNFWITSAPGSGKSTLSTLLEHLHGGDKGVLKAENATAASISGILRMSTLPVLLDELEPDDQGSAKERQIVELMRIASSGGRRIRSAPDQRTHETVIRSTFMASSILIPGALKSQDLQRLIVLNLNPFPKGAVAPRLQAALWRRRGAALKRIGIDRWPSWPQRLEAWREAFGMHGIAGRDASNWATVLAMAQMLRDPALPEAEATRAIAGKVAREIRATLAEAGTDSDEVLVHLLSQPYDVFRRGEQFTVAQWLMVAAGAPRAPANLLDSHSTDPHGQKQRQREANAKLARALLRIVPDPAGPWLFVGHGKVQPLLDLFAGTRWAGGAWTQSLARVLGARPSAVARTLAGIPSRGTEIPLSSIPGIMWSAEDAATPAPVAAARDEAEDWG